MQDEEMTFANAKEKVLSFCREREWEQFHTPKNLSMALAAEAAELMEHFLWSESDRSVELLEDAQKGPKIREELADVVIYALEFANMAKIDLATTIAEKMKANAVKYPVEKARGKSLKYTEL